MSQSVRTLGAGALGALIVAVAALSVHVGPTTAADPTTPANPATHTISVSASGKVTVVPDVARVTLGVTITRPTVKAARANAAASMTKIIAAVKGLGVADADIQTVGLNLYPQYANGSREPDRRLPDQRAAPDHGPRHRQDRRRGRRGNCQGRDRRQRHLVRAGRSGQGDERRPRQRGRCRPGQCPGDGDGRPRHPRPGGVDQ